MQRTLCVGGVCKSMKELIYGCWYSPRASGMFNHVTEAKMVKSVFFSKKSMLNSKIKLKKNRLVHKVAIRNGLPPG